MPALPSRQVAPGYLRDRQGQADWRAEPGHQAVGASDAWKPGERLAEEDGRQRGAAISAKQVEERIELRNRLSDLAKASGYSVSELFGGKVKAGKAIAYRHPNDPSLTWSGRGRRPTWLAKELDEGKRLEEMAA